MNEDLDTKLYNEFLSGNKEAFDSLYTKYKSKIHYFILNIIKDSSKAEKIMQDTFMYMLKNKSNLEYSFKNYIYLVAKSRAISYINVEKRRKQIDDKYLSDISKDEEADILDDIAKNEHKKEILKTMEKLDDRYKNAIYLTKIEGFSYSEVSDILGESVANVKNLVHRGKSKLRKLIINERWYNMNKSLKVIIYTHNYYNNCFFCYLWRN